MGPAGQDAPRGSGHRARSALHPVEDFAFLDFDSTGRHLLFVKEGENGEPFRRSEGDRVLMARDFLEADW